MTYTTNNVLHHLYNLMNDNSLEIRKKSRAVYKAYNVLVTKINKVRDANSDYRSLDKPLVNLREKYECLNSAKISLLNELEKLGHKVKK